MSSTGWILIVLGVMLVIYGLLRKFFPKFLTQFMNNNILDMFKIAGILSAFSEVITLTTLATDRGIEPISAISRYAGLSLVETITGIWFISGFVKALEEKTKDGIITLWEIIVSIVTVSWIFAISFFFTNKMYLLYLESINRIEVQQGFLSWYNAFMGSVFQTDPEQYDAIAKTAVIGRIEMGAQSSILLSVWINLMTVPYLIFRNKDMIRLFNPNYYIGVHFYSIEFIFGRSDSFITPDEKVKILEKLKSKRVSDTKKAPPRVLKEEDINKANGTSTGPIIKNDFFEFGDVSSKSLDSFMPFIKTALGVSEKDWKSFLYEYIGVNLETKEVKKTNLTRSGEPAEILKNLSKKLISDDRHNLVSLQKVATSVVEEIDIVKKSRVKMESLKHAGILENDKDYISEKERYVSFIKKLQGFHAQFKSNRELVAQKMQTEGCKVPNASVSIFEKDIKDLEEYIAKS